MVLKVKREIDRGVKPPEEEIVKVGDAAAGRDVEEVMEAVIR